MTSRVAGASGISFSLVRDGLALYVLSFLEYAGFSYPEHRKWYWAWDIGLSRSFFPYLFLLATIWDWTVSGVVRLFCGALAAYACVSGPRLHLLIEHPLRV
jgi:hypothetical protein